MFVSAGSVSTIATSSGASAAARVSGSLNWAMRVRPVTLLERPRWIGSSWPVLEAHEPLLEVPVVVAIEQHDDLASRHGPGKTDGLGVRLRGGQRELPENGTGYRRARSSATQTASSVGSRNWVERATCAGDGFHHGRVGVAAEHGHVGGVEVEVGRAVDVRETSTIAAVHEDRLLRCRRPSRTSASRSACGLRARSRSWSVFGCSSLKRESSSSWRRADQVAVEVTEGGHPMRSVPSVRAGRVQPTTRNRCRGRGPL